MSTCTNEKYELNWTDRNGTQPSREAASLAGSHTGSPSMWDNVEGTMSNRHIGTLIPAARDEGQL